MDGPAWSVEDMVVTLLLHMSEKTFNTPWKKGFNWRWGHSKGAIREIHHFSIEGIKNSPYEDVKMSFHLCWPPALCLHAGPTARSCAFFWIAPSSRSPWPSLPSIQPVAIFKAKWGRVEEVLGYQLNCLLTPLAAIGAQFNANGDKLI